MSRVIQGYLLSVQGSLMVGLFTVVWGLLRDVLGYSGLPPGAGCGMRCEGGLLGKSRRCVLGGTSGRHATVRDPARATRSPARATRSPAMRSPLPAPSQRGPRARRAQVRGGGRARERVGLCHGATKAQRDARIAHVALGDEDQNHLRLVDVLFERVDRLKVLSGREARRCEYR